MDITSFKDSYFMVAYYVKVHLNLLIVVISLDPFLNLMEPYSYHFKGVTFISRSPKLLISLLKYFSFVHHTVPLNDVILKS